ncbi:MAG: iron ABC transporter permease [Bacteroidota bacterium]|nr:iron ABC transporter permease [Bacteroidota bacterium]
MFRQSKFFFPVTIILLVIVLLCAIAFGAVSITVHDMFSALLHAFQNKKPANIYEGVFLEIRLPRVLLGAVTGAILSVSGVLLQGLFRNPIVEPGLIGTSAGAAFGASVVFVFAVQMNEEIRSLAGPLLVPLFAFGGGLLATFLVYSISKSQKKMSVTSLLLVGIAINAIGLSGTGFMSYVARDPQARSITFWNLGTFSGATWPQVFIVTCVAFVVFIISLRYSKQLNALILGEEEATHLGVSPEKLKKRIMILSTAMVAVATAFVGVISFIGLIVPHILRLLIGSDNKKLIPASMIMGAIILTVADMGARLLLAPAEVPIGIITSIAGAPVFIFLLKKFNLLQEKGGPYA